MAATKYKIKRRILCMKIKMKEFKVKIGYKLYGYKFVNETRTLSINGSPKLKVVITWGKKQCY